MLAVMTDHFRFPMINKSSNVNKKNRKEEGKVFEINNSTLKMILLKRINWLLREIF